MDILETGHPGYDTSIGWFNYSDEQVVANVAKSVSEGFTAMKLKVGSPDNGNDVRHARLGHEAVFLEHIPHLREHFTHPCLLERGTYRTPDQAGATCDLKTISKQ